MKAQHALLLTVLWLVVGGCGGDVEATKTMTFENGAEAAITVRVNERLVALIQPGATKDFRTPNNKGNRRVIAVDEKGGVRLDRTFSWEELEVVGFRVVIR